MNFTRKEFLQASMLTLSSLYLAGCHDSDPGRISHIELVNRSEIKSNYRFVVFFSNQDDVEKSNLPDVMLIYDSYHQISRHTFEIHKYYGIAKWRDDETSEWLTTLYHSIEESYVDFQEKYSILEEFDAYSLITERYGHKLNYSSEEIQEIISVLKQEVKNNYSGSVYQKT